PYCKHLYLQCGRRALLAAPPGGTMGSQPSVRELALIAGALAALVLGRWLSGVQAGLAERVTGVAVIAVSDSREDQEPRLPVRDHVLAVTEEIYPENATLEEAQAALEDHLALLAQAGRETVEEWGQDYSVTASLEDTWFPTKEYDGFALPAG